MRKKVYQKTMDVSLIVQPPRLGPASILPASPECISGTPAATFIRPDAYRSSGNSDSNFSSVIIGAESAMIGESIMLFVQWGYDRVSHDHVQG
jgi:hypothetical protein